MLVKLPRPQTPPSAYLLDGVLHVAADRRLYRCPPGRPLEWIATLPEDLVPRAQLGGARTLWTRSWIGRIDNAMGTQSSVHEGRHLAFVASGQDWLPLTGELCGRFLGSVALRESDDVSYVGLEVDANPFGDDVLTAHLHYRIDLAAGTATLQQEFRGERLSLPHVHRQASTRPERPLPVEAELVGRVGNDVLGLTETADKLLVQSWRLDDDMLRGCGLHVPGYPPDEVDFELPFELVAVGQQEREPWDPGVVVTRHANGRLASVGLYHGGRLKGWELRPASSGQRGVLIHETGRRREFEAASPFVDQPVAWLDWVHQALAWIQRDRAEAARTPLELSDDEIWCRIDASHLPAALSGGDTPGFRAEFHPDGQLKAFGYWDGVPQGPQLTLALGQPKSEYPGERYPGQGWKSWVLERLAHIAEREWFCAGLTAPVSDGQDGFEVLHYPNGQLRSFAHPRGKRLELEFDVPRGQVVENGQTHMLYRRGGKLAFEGGKLHPEPWDRWTAYWIKTIHHDSRPR